MDRYAKLCWSVASRCAPYATAQDLEEIVADVFIDFWKNSGRYDETKASLKKYLSVIARNKAADFSRKYRPATELPDSAASGEDPADAYERQLDADELNRAFDALPPREREILYRRYVEGEMPAAIAKALGMDVKLVKNILYR